MKANSILHSEKKPIDDRNMKSAEKEAYRVVLEVVIVLGALVGMVVYTLWGMGAFEVGDWRVEKRGNGETGEPVVLLREFGEGRR
jgi:hypothetical protein